MIVSIPDLCTITYFLIYTLFIWSLENFKRNSGYLGLQVTINIGRDKQKLEDLKVLRRSPDLLNNVKIGQGQLQLTNNEKNFVLPHIGVAAILVK